MERALADEQLPIFDDAWVADARLTEPSVSELERRRGRARRVTRRRRVRRALSGWGAIALFAVGGWYLSTSPSWRHGELLGSDAAVVHRIWSAQAAGDRPTPTWSTGDRLMDAVTPPASSSYAFAHTDDDGTPITYDPCRPVSIVVNPAGAPPGYRDVVDRAIRRVSAASGLRVDLVGETDEVPSVDRALFDHDRYGDRWAPVLLAWTDESVIVELAGNTAGVGGSGWTSYESEPAWYVSGIVFLDTDLGVDLAMHEAVMLHELGHVLGLDHVDDPSQLMHGEATVTALGTGDLAGLARAGAGRCAGLL